MFPIVKSFPTRDLRQLVPSAQESLKIILAECVKRGIGIFLTQTYRSTAYQVKVHKEKPDSSAEPGFSMHEFRMAVDIATKGKNLYDPKTLEAAASIFKAHGWTCGRDWKMRDDCHFQFCTLAEQSTIRRLKTPELIDKYVKARKK